MIHQNKAGDNKDNGQRSEKGDCKIGSPLVT